MGASVFVPALVSALSPAVRARSQAWRPVGPLGSFRLGDVVKVNVTPPPQEYAVKVVPAQAVYVWQKAPSEIVVFSRTCTDLGCAVNHDAGSGFYYCPCHGGIFNTHGEPVAGPPQRPLYRYATRVRDGVLEIDLRSVPVVA
jgi:menaquinol-cytochrome c reductase iron-sulfur subunit